MKPEKRQEFASNIKKHVFFEDINWDDVLNKRIEPSYIPRIKNDLDLQYFDKVKC